MIRLFKISSDTTIYEWNKTLNAGADEILEMTVRTSADWGKSTNESSRILIKPAWPVNGTTEQYARYAFTSASLRLFAANVEGAEDRSTKAEIFPLTSQWKEGTGKYFDNHNVQDAIGANWNFRSNESNGVEWPTPSAAAGHASSSTTAGNGGGTWYTGSNSGSVSSFIDDGPSYNSGELESTRYDLNIDITTYLTHVSNSALTNHGLIIKHQNESGSIAPPAIKYFSADTNTIYYPRVEHKVDDYSWSTSKTAIGTEQATVYYKSNSGKYDRRQMVRFRPVVRETFPEATYTTASVADTIKTFTATKACYAIIDEKTDEEIIGFDSTFTRVCADSEGMYFDVDMDSLEVGRVYKPVLRVAGRVGGTYDYEYFDNKDYFEVV